MFSPVSQELDNFWQELRSGWGWKWWAHGSKWLSSLCKSVERPSWVSVYLARGAPKRQSFILRPAFNQNLHSSHTVNKKNHWPLSRSAGLRDGRWLRWASLRIRVSHRCGLLPVLREAAPVLSQPEVIEWKWWPSYRCSVAQWQRLGKCWKRKGFFVLSFCSRVEWLLMDKTPRNMQGTTCKR